MRYLQSRILFVLVSNCLLLYFILLLKLLDLLMEIKNTLPEFAFPSPIALVGLSMSVDLGDRLSYFLASSCWLKLDIRIK